MGWIIGFLTNALTWLGGFGIKYAKGLAQFVVLVGINTALIVAYVSFVVSVISVVWWVYKKINYLLEYITLGNSDSIVSQGIKIVKASGVWDGFSDAFSLISGGLILLFVAYLSKLAFNALLHLRNTVLSFIIALK